MLYARLDVLSLAGLAPALAGLRDLVLVAARAVAPRHAWDHVRGTQVGTSRTGSPLVTPRTRLQPGAGEPQGFSGAAADVSVAAAALARIGSRSRQGAPGPPAA